MNLRLVLPAFVILSATVALPDVSTVRERALIGAESAERVVEESSDPPDPPRPPIETPVFGAGFLAWSFRNHPPPRAASAAPTLAEWNDALPMAFGSDCEGARVREWLRLRCRTTSVQKAALVAGSREGVRLASYVDRPDTWSGVNEVILPVREGDARVVTFTSALFERYSGMMANTDHVLSETWPEGDETPTVVLE